MVEYRTKLVAPSDSALVDCPVAAPPSIPLYLEAKEWPEKEKMLIDKIHELIANQINCNIRWKGVRTWKADQLLEIEKENQK